MGIEENEDFRDDIMGLQTALGVLEKCQDGGDRQHVLELILLVLSRLQVQVEDELSIKD